VAEQSETEAGRARLLEELERKLREAPSKIYRSFGEGSGYRRDGISIVDAWTVATFFREVAIEADDISLLGSAEILHRVASEVAELDDLDERENRRELAELCSGSSEAAKKGR
jgi:hypothetical protein